MRPDAYSEINNFYTATVYEKGAEVVRMITTLVGAGGFRRGMDLYFERHDGQAATIEDFLQCLRGRHRPRPLAFRALVLPGRHPGGRGVGALRRGGETYRLEFAPETPPTPGQPDKGPMVIPVVLGLVGRRRRADCG